MAAGPSAVAAPDVANLPVATANPGLPASVIAGLPPIVQKSHTKLSLESYIPGSPIVYPDGTPVPGQSKAALAKLDSIDAASGGLARFSGNWCMTAYAIAGGGWSPPSVCPVAVWGSPGWSYPYSWARIEHGESTGCLQGRGWTVVSGGGGTIVPLWRGIGCGIQSGGAVSWGNVLGNPAVIAKSSVALMGFAANWT
ncbi:hypothetical protein Cch01nite_28450 [Cellulomonas chitinilytica]|uniref:Uncharacterized protein n=1 Tax=Cellulomonas chitinilytica TaxID=398759 RepID=A0A919P2D3_9CELL|nr:hypothetical protein [Cellulomonas chitinilytica]GIG22121.1 hypothetical protein Cch01nite_28450 [Cellulomonas chitinilytica]